MRGLKLLIDLPSFGLELSNPEVSISSDPRKTCVCSQEMDINN